MDNPPPFTPPPITPLRPPPPGMSAGTPPPISPPPGASPPPPPPNYLPNPEGEARTWNMLCHLSALSGCLIPLGNIFGPLLVWLLKKNEFPSVEAHGKAALNFQLTVLITLVVGAVAFFVLHFICIGFLLVPFLILIPVAGLIFPIVAALKASSGAPCQYPYSLDLIK